MPGELLLVGSIPVQTAEEAFRKVGAPLGPWLDYMPDGEVGDAQLLDRWPRLPGL